MLMDAFILPSILSVTNVIVGYDQTWEIHNGDRFQSQRPEVRGHILATIQASMAFAIIILLQTR